MCSGRLHKLEEMKMIFDQLWKLQRERTELEKRFGRMISQAEREGDHEKRESLISELLMERGLIDDRINGLESIRIQERAERLGVPIPPLSDKESWENGYKPNTIFLSVKARAQLRSEIRKERRERWDWITRIITLLVGLIGAITGLISVWKK